MASKNNSNYYHKVSVIKGHHVYKAIWTPTIGEKLPVQFEDDNAHERTVFPRKGTAVTKHFSSIVPWLQFEGRLLYEVR